MILLWLGSTDMPKPYSLTLGGILEWVGFVACRWLSKGGNSVIISQCLAGRAKYVSGGLASG